MRHCAEHQVMCRCQFRKSSALIFKSREMVPDHSISMNGCCRISQEMRSIKVRPPARIDEGRATK